MLITAENSPFPRGVLIGAGTLLAFTLIMAGIARHSGYYKRDLPVSAPVESRMLRFEDRSDGAVTVLDTQENRLIAVLAPGTNGFARGVMRGLARFRKRGEIGDTPSFKLTHWSDGRVSLEDPTTNRTIELDAFGETNVGVFAKLLDKHNDLAGSSQ
jgi:putative photosynthetic complex assembly protein